MPQNYSINLIIKWLFDYRNTKTIEFVAPHLAPGIKKVPENQRLNLKLAVRTVGMKQI
jgi:hypothetical protein